MSRFKAARVWFARVCATSEQKTETKTDCDLLCFPVASICHKFAVCFARGSNMRRANQTRVATFGANKAIRNSFDAHLFRSNGAQLRQYCRSGSRNCDTAFKTGNKFFAAANKQTNFFGCLWRAEQRRAKHNGIETASNWVGEYCSRVKSCRD